MSNDANILYDELETWCQVHQAHPVWQYSVPLLGEGGTCSLFGELDPEPFSLQSVLNEDQLALVPQVQAIVDWVKEKTNLDWFGIYLKRQTQESDYVLTKLAYFGAPSRAEFPLTQQFAQISNNSKVGLTGEERVINDVCAYTAQGGEYYTCDPKVQSELCWPILTLDLQDKISPAAYQDEHILGIIDAECFETDCFDAQTQAIFRAVCRKLSQLLAK